MRLKNILSKYQGILLVIAVILTSIAISIRGSDGEVRLVLQEYPALIFLLVIMSLILVAIYFNLNSKKISSLTDQIKEQSKSEGMEELLIELTERQREVYDMIILGKTNKEIVNELFIEQSTLKTHINQIYRKLDIKSRHELKSKSTR